MLTCECETGSWWGSWSRGGGLQRLLGRWAITAIVGMLTTVLRWPWTCGPTVHAMQLHRYAAYTVCLGRGLNGFDWRSMHSTSMRMVTHSSCLREVWHDLRNQTRFEWRVVNVESTSIDLRSGLSVA